MEFSTLRNSFAFSIHFDPDQAAEVAAIAVGKAVRNATKALLDRAIADTRSVIAAERTAKEVICNVVSNTCQVTEAVIDATDVRLDAAIETKVIAPATQAKAAIIKPIAKGWNTGLDIITDYLESTPVKTAPVLESFPMTSEGLDDVVAELEAQLPDAIEACRPQIVNGAVVTADGISELPDLDSAENGEEVDILADHSFDELLYEEVAAIL